MRAAVRQARVLLDYRGDRTQMRTISAAQFNAVRSIYVYGPTGGLRLLRFHHNMKLDGRFFFYPAIHYRKSSIRNALVDEISFDTGCAT